MASAGRSAVLGCLINNGRPNDWKRTAMIKDILVRLDGTPQDDIRLAAVDQIAAIFASHITGLYFNLQSPLTSGEVAKEDGDAVEAAAMLRLRRLQQDAHLRRFDVA